MILTFIFSVSVLINLVMVAFETNMSVHIVNLLFKQDFYSRDDVDVWLHSIGNHTWAEWYGCPLCFGTSVAFSIGVVGLLITGISINMLWWPFAFALATPWIPHLILKRISFNR